MLDESLIKDVEVLYVSRELQKRAADSLIVEVDYLKALLVKMARAEKNKIDRVEGEKDSLQLNLYNMLSELVSLRLKECEEGTSAALSEKFDDAWMRAAMMVEGVWIKE